MSNFRVSCLAAIVAVMCLQGCSGAIVSINPALPPLTYEGPSDKIPLNVGLSMSSELRHAQWFKGGHGGGDRRCKLILGDLFVRNSEQLARTIFDEVVVLADSSDPAANDVDAVLRPHMVSVERSRPVYIYQEQRLSVVFEWTLSKPGGGVIWADTIAAEGRGPLATKAALNFNSCAEGLQEGAKIQLEDLMNDLFRKSYASMSSARAVREFAR